MYTILIYLLCLGTICIGITINPVQSLLGLMAVVLSLVILMLELNIEIIAILLLLIYVGAVIVLFIFVIMLLNIKIINQYSMVINYSFISVVLGSIFIICFILGSWLSYNDYTLINNFYLNWSVIININLMLVFVGYSFYIFYGYYLCLLGLILLLTLIGVIMLLKE